MKTLYKILGLILLLGCKSNPQSQPQPKLYLFETAEYCDFDTAERTIYIKSHRQLIETGVNFRDRRVDGWDKVYNALGHEVSQSYMSPKICVRPGDDYDITIHQHSSGDNTITISSAVVLENLRLTRYYMHEVLKISDLRCVFQFLDPLDMTESIEIDSRWTGLYIVTLKNMDSIDWEGGERVVLEYESYKIPIPWQIFEE